MHRRYSWILSPLPHLGVSLSNVSNDHTFVIVYSPCAGCWAAPGFPNDRRGSPFRRQHTGPISPKGRNGHSVSPPVRGHSSIGPCLASPSWGGQPFCPCSRRLPQNSEWSDFHTVARGFLLSPLRLHPKPYRVATPVFDHLALCTVAIHRISTKGWEREPLLRKTMLVTMSTMPGRHSGLPLAIDVVFPRLCGGSNPRI